MKEIIDFLKLVSDENRLRIMLAVLKREMCVCEIINELGLSQSLISHNLSLLRKNDLVRGEKDGKWVFYAANEVRVKEMLTKVNKLLLEINSNEYPIGRNYDYCIEHDP